MVGVGVERLRRADINEQRAALAAGFGHRQREIFPGVGERLEGAIVDPHDQQALFVQLDSGRLCVGHCEKRVARRILASPRVFDKVPVLLTQGIGATLSAPMFSRISVGSGSGPILQSDLTKRGSGGTGRPTSLRGWRSQDRGGLESPLPHQIKKRPEESGPFAFLPIQWSRNGRGWPKVELSWAELGQLLAHEGGGDHARRQLLRSQTRVLRQRERTVLWYARHLSRTREARDFSSSGGGGRRVPPTGNPTGKSW